MLTIAPSPPLRGTVSLPGDKSISHRVALLAALAEGESRFENFLVAGVTRAMLNALTALGVDWLLNGNTLTVQGRGFSGLQPPAAPLDCGNSATTMRMLAGAIAAAGLPAVLDGSPGLRRRPMKRITEPLQQMGVDVKTANGCAPLTFYSPQSAPRPARRTPLQPLTYTLPVASAQVKSCLLLAALSANGPTTLTEPGPSRDHTERLLAGMGVSVDSGQWGVDGEQSAVRRNTQYVTTLTPFPAPLPSISLTLPGDVSSAAFLVVAALITPDSDITLTGVGLNPTRTGLLDALRMMGGDIRVSNEELRHNEPVGDITVRHSQLHGIAVRGPLVVRMIDEFPAFAVAAAFAQGSTTVRDAAELRHKETDRISVLCQQLRAVGIPVTEAPDGFTLAGSSPPAGGFVDPHGDHRLAMSLAVAGLAARKPIAIQNPGIIHESFPGFQKTLAYLGAELD